MSLLIYVLFSAQCYVEVGSELVMWNVMVIQDMLLMTHSVDKQNQERLDHVTWDPVHVTGTTLVGIIW